MGGFEPGRDGAGNPRRGRSTATGPTLSMRVLVCLLEMRQVVEERVDSSHVTITYVWRGIRDKEDEGESVMERERERERE